MSRTFKAAVRGVDIAGGRVHLSFDPTPRWFSLPEPELARRIRWDSTATVRGGGHCYEGFVSDSAITVAVGEVPLETTRLLETTRRALEAATEQAHPGNHLGDIGHAIQSLAESRGYGVVRDLVSHGVGRKMHEDPQIPNYGRPGTGPRLLSGMTFAIEPMITLGSYEIRLSEWDGWSIYTADGSLAAHFEHTIAVTDEGPWVLTRNGGETG